MVSAAPKIQVKRARFVQRRKGIETEYAGIRFRSRLEARWAAFFDELGLKWDYEPLDLDFYIPDFRILFDKSPLLIEIKPDQESFPAARQKIEQSGWMGDIAVLDSAATRFVGMFREEVWDRAVLASCLACTKPTIAHESGRWECRNCGAENRSLWWAFDARPMWNSATNKVQWRPKNK